MIKLLSLLCVVLVSGAASADPVTDALRLWSSQQGIWVGEIDIYGPDGTEPQTVGLRTMWNATPDQAVPVKIETFSSPRGQFSSVTLMLADSNDGRIVTPYFSNGKQRDYYFSVVRVEETDDANWTIVIASPNGEEIYEDRPAVLRYVRTRTGDTIENTKEVNFLDDDGDDTFELRSFIRQTRLSSLDAP